MLCGRKVIPAGTIAVYHRLTNLFEALAISVPSSLYDSNTSIVLDNRSTVKEYLTVQMEGNRTNKRTGETKHRKVSRVIPVSVDK